MTGDAEASIEHFERGIATNPYLADHFKRNLSLACFLAERPGDGLAVLRGSEADAAGARLHRTLNQIALGDQPQAAAEAQVLLEESPDFRAGALPMFGAFRRAADREKILSALEKAGLPR